MPEATAVQRLPVSASSGDRARVRRLLGVSLLFLGAQVSLTDYGASGSGAGVLWFAVGCLLLWMVSSRRSRVARGVVVVTSLFGAVLYGGAALSGDLHAVLIALTFLGQAAPLLTRSVREHVTRSP
jgi:hypothetical protein